MVRPASLWVSVSLGLSLCPCLHVCVCVVLCGVVWCCVVLWGLWCLWSLYVRACFMFLCVCVCTGGCGRKNRTGEEGHEQMYWELPFPLSRVAGWHTCICFSGPGLVPFLAPGLTRRTNSARGVICFSPGFQRSKHNHITIAARANLGRGTDSASVIKGRLHQIMLGIGP